MIKEELVAQIQQFFMEEDLDEIGRFQAERLIEEMIKLVDHLHTIKQLEMQESL